MKGFMSIVLATVIVSAAIVCAGEDEPVVLVHGGGQMSEAWEVKDSREPEGLIKFAIEISKYESNWRRAAEIYAQLKGTVVDYGACHSAENGQKRFGKNFTGQGLFPEWSESHKINLWGYSFGGATVVALEKILLKGSGCLQDSSPLFSGGNNWVSSVSTFSRTTKGSRTISLISLTKTISQAI